MSSQKENTRICCMCGSSPSKDPSITLHRFPKPGSKNALRCESWAKYCFRNEAWSSPKFQDGLHSKHKMLCSKHFKSTCFNEKKLFRTAIPGVRCLKVGNTDICDDDHYAGDGSDTLVESNVCRVCLTMDVKMYNLKDTELRDMFQNITGIAVTEDNHSILERLCWECAGRLKAAAAFRNKALLSDALLQGLASTGEKIRKNDITLIKDSEDYLKSAGTLNVVEVFHSIDIDPENDGIPPLSENHDTEIVQNTVRKDSFKLKKDSIIEEGNDQTDVEDESMIEAPIEIEMKYDQFDHKYPPNTGEESSNAFIETNPLVSNYVTLGDDKISSADSSPLLPGCSHVEPKNPIFVYIKKTPSDCGEDKIKKHVIITTKRNSISKLVSKNSLF